MSLNSPSWIACLSMMLLSVQGVSADPHPDEQEVARLIRQLDSDDFDKREAASEQLETIGEPVRPALKKAAAASGDAEIRARAKGLIQILNTKLQILCSDLHSDLVLGVAFTPNSEEVLSASCDGTVRMFTAHTGQLIHSLVHPAARNVAVSPDGKLAISTGIGPENQTWRLWDLESGKELRRFSDYPSTASGVTFSSDGKKVLLGADVDSSLRLLDVESGLEVRKFAGHSAGVHSVGLSVDGKRSVSGSPDWSVRLWNNETGEELKRLDGHKDLVWSVAISPDGKRAVSGGRLPAIKLWDLEAGKEIRELKGHTDGVHSLAWSRDGRRIVSGSYDRTVGLWDAETGDRLHSFEGHTDVVYTVAVSPDGRLIASGGRDKTVRVWRVPK